MTIYFKNLTVELHILYVLKTRVKFHINQMLYIIWSINLNFYVILDYKNSKFKDLINDITIDLWPFWNFANMEDIRRKCNPMVNLSQFTSNKKILNGIIVLDLELNLLPNFVQNLIKLCLKNFKVVTNIF